MAGEEGRPLYLTPSLYISAIIAMFIIVSLALERFYRWLTNWLRNNEMAYLVAAVHTMAKEIGLLGLMSLLLSATSAAIPHWCIPTKVTDAVDMFSMCTLSKWHGEIPRKHFAEEVSKNTCKENFEPFISSKAMEQLHLFTFLLAIAQVLYTSMTLYLATLKIRSWRVWENEIQMHVPSDVCRNRFLLWVVCLFRSFSHSVVQDDYLRLRQIFIMKNNLPSTYDFHGHILRSLNEDFQRIVDVNPILWMCAVILMVLNVVRFRLYFWVPVISSVLLLLIGTKLQHVLIVLTSERAANRPQNEQFWFNKPKLMFFLIRFILFQSVFELASFIWILWQFNNESCILRDAITTCVALLAAFVGMVLCTYNILPLYLLVSQRQTEEGERVELTEIAIVHNMSEFSGMSYLQEVTSGTTSFRSCSVDLEREVGTKYKKEDSCDEAPRLKKMKY